MQCQGDYDKMRHIHYYQYVLLRRRLRRISKKWSAYKRAASPTFTYKINPICVVQIFVGGDHVINSKYRKFTNEI